MVYVLKQSAHISRINTVHSEIKRRYNMGFFSSTVWIILTFLFFTVLVAVIAA